MTDRSRMRHTWCAKINARSRVCSLCTCVCVWVCMFYVRVFVRVCFSDNDGSNFLVLIVIHNSGSNSNGDSSRV